MEATYRLLFNHITRLDATENYTRILKEVCPGEDVAANVMLSPEKLHEVLVRIQLNGCGVFSKQTVAYCKRLERLVIQARNDARTDRLCAALANLAVQAANDIVHEKTSTISSVSADMTDCIEVFPDTVDPHQCASVEECEKWINEHREDIEIWLKKETFSGFSVGLYMAAHGYLNLMMHMPENYPITGWSAAYAAANGHIHILEWLKTINTVKTHRAQEMAAHCGNLESLIWLDNNEYPRSIFAFHQAVVSGHIHVLKWMLCNNYPIHSGVVEDAIIRGNLEVLKLLHTIITGKPSAHIVAAKCGHLDIVKWLYKVGIHPTTEAATTAAYYGHLDVLKYFHKHDCTIDDQVCKNAAINGSGSIFAYAIKNGFPRPSNLVDLCTPELREWLTDYDKLCAKYGA